MTAAGEEERGAAAEEGPKESSAAKGKRKGKEKEKAKVEQGLRLFNTEGRTKQVFRPQDRRQVLNSRS